MSDQTITCRDCGEAFTFTAGEQAFFQERGFTQPQRCPTCRSARKAQRSDDGYGSSGNSYSGGGGGGYGGGGYASSGPREMHPAVCASCGQQTEVPFVPRTDKPVYCRDCFQERRASAPRSGYRSY